MWIDKYNLAGVYLLLLGLPFHLLLLLGLEDPSGLFGAHEELSLTSAVLLGIYVIFMMVSMLLRQRRPATTRYLQLIAALIFLPVYMWVFPPNLSLSLLGLAACLLQAYFLFIAFPQSTPADYDVDYSMPPLSTAGFDLILLSSAGSCTVILLVAGYHLMDSLTGMTAAWIFISLTLLISIPTEIRFFKPTLRGGPYLEYVLLTAAFASFFLPVAVALPLLAVRQLVVGIRIWLHARGGQKIWHFLMDRPAHLLVLSFALAISIGTVSLSLPAATAGLEPLNFIDALFTATSATCVTGLIVVDTGTAFSLFGQLVILTLIQIGGLGIMTISTFLALILGRSIGLRGEFAIGEMIGEQHGRTAFKLLYFIVLFTAVIEAVGALILSWNFRQHGFALLDSLYLGIFHSISAFCNAGFSLFSDSFVQYASAPAFPLVISALIILGGLGFAVLFAFSQIFEENWRLSPHVRLVLAGTLILAVAGSIIIWLIERNGALAHLSTGDSLINAWFQSITTRTAGFNTVDQADFSAASKLLVMGLMFIGAAPGSTGGGIKITTAAVLLLVVRTVLTGRKNVVFAGRKIEPDIVINAIALLCIAMLAVVLTSLFLLLTQPLTPVAVIFEAFSAFGTVGLSLGATAQLNPSGKLAIILLMFIGRVGPLTLLVMMRPRTKPAIDYPSANVMIG